MPCKEGGLMRILVETEKFRRLFVECAETTENVCVVDNGWIASQLCEVAEVGGVADTGELMKKLDEIEMTKEITQIVTFLQAKIDNGYFCKKDERLVICNFHPLYMGKGLSVSGLDMIIKPLEESSGLKSSRGAPLYLVINGTTGEIGDVNYGLAIFGKEVQNKNGMKSKRPLIYGNYKNPKPIPHNFVTLLDQLRATTEEVPKEKENQAELGKSAIHFSFQPTFKPEGDYRKESMSSDNVCAVQEPQVSSKPAAVKPETGSLRHLKIRPVPAAA